MSDQQTEENEPKSERIILGIRSFTHHNLNGASIIAGMNEDFRAMFSRIYSNYLQNGTLDFLTQEKWGDRLEELMDLLSNYLRLDPNNPEREVEVKIGATVVKMKPMNVLAAIYAMENYDEDHVNEEYENYLNWLETMFATLIDFTYEQLNRLVSYIYDELVENKISLNDANDLSKKLNKFINWAFFKMHQTTIWWGYKYINLQNEVDKLKKYIDELREP